MFPKEAAVGWCACFLGVLVMLATYAWVEVYKVWKSRFRGSSLSTTYQKV